jgi:hypothetical protein
MSDSQQLAASHAGLRLIALLTFYNQGAIDRLRAYLKEHLAETALEEESPASRLAALKMLASEAGRLKVRQVVAADKHHVVALLHSERGGMVLTDLEVSADYPHKILLFALGMIGEESSDPQ